MKIRKVFNSSVSRRRERRSYGCIKADKSIFLALIVLIIVFGSKQQGTNLILLDYLNIQLLNDLSVPPIPDDWTTSVQSQANISSSVSTPEAAASRMRHDRPHHVLLVPFRGREHHLRKFIPHMGRYLQRNFGAKHDFSVWVLEQADDKPFNKGVLINTGLAELEKRMSSTRCVVMHDVDLVPENDGVPYPECTWPTQLSSELEHFNFTVPYLTGCGGVISMDLRHWQYVNGMSNDYVGWGGEDDDLHIRLFLRRLLKEGNIANLYQSHVYRPPKGYGRYVNLEGGAKQPSYGMVKANHSNYEHNVKILGEMRDAKTWHRYLKDGLSDLKYEILEEFPIQNITGVEFFFNAWHFKIQGRDRGWL